MRIRTAPDGGCDEAEFSNITGSIVDAVRESASTGERSEIQVQHFLRASELLSQKLYNLNQGSDDAELQLRLLLSRSERLSTQPQLQMFPHLSTDYGPTSNAHVTNWDPIFEDERGWEQSFDANTTTFSTRGQVRRGSAHGKGGRLPGSGAQVRRNYAKYARIVLYKRFHGLLHDYVEGNFTTGHARNRVNRIKAGASSVVMKMIHELATDPATSSLNIAEPIIHRAREMLIGELEKCTESKLPASVQHLPYSTMGIVAKFTKSDFVEPKSSEGASKTFNVRERHVIATWVDRRGFIKCTCIGSTQYEIYALNHEFGTSCCIHARAVNTVLQELCMKMFGNPSIPFRILYEGFSAVYQDFNDDISLPLPMFHSVHGGNTVILVDKDIGEGTQLQWVPIRKVQRSGGRFLCAFCDLVDSNNCYHISALRTHCGETIQQPELESNEYEADAEVEYHRENMEYIRATKPTNHQPVSSLPLSPVNCPWALQVDQDVCDLLKRKGVFKVKSPLSCPRCDGPRIENTRDTNTSGIVMCSLGACAMEVETFLCSGCGNRYSAEGREEGIFIDSICLAATHKLLRDQLIGFALGNGTLSSRLSQFHSQVSAFEDARVFKTVIPSRSTRKLYDLCVYFLRLMVCDPPTSLFVCNTCQVTNRTQGREEDCDRTFRAVCVDGIWAGYQKKKAVPFENVSQACASPVYFSRSVRSSNRKPRTAFLRLEKTVTFLLNAIKGREVDVTIGSIPALVGAVRIASDTALPPDLYASSVCGAFPTDYTNDIGEGSLKKLRRLTQALFRAETIVYRLLEPLRRLLQKQRKRKRTAPSSAKNSGNSEGYTAVTSAISQISGLVQNDDLVAWNAALEPFAKQADFGRKLLLLYRSLMQGPLTHMIRRDETTSAALTAQACMQYKAEDFMKAMVGKKFTCCASAGKAASEGQNILQNLRILAAGLFCASVVDRHNSDTDTKTAILPAFGEVLFEAVRLVKGFYQFYDAHALKASTTAAKYSLDWNSGSFGQLRAKFEKVAASEQLRHSWCPDYDDPFVTGAYFPSLPQVRPLPFNDRKDAALETDAFGFCSKHYLQRNASFTPGALTFSCSCAHPKVLGFKVLERDEGPRAVLDILVSRFARLPDFVIYDFACGVYKSAVNALWWVVQSSTLVSDPFHANNHTCSPIFVPSSHVKLNMLNTISHEQRNRPIAKIKGSLQQTSQDVYISLLAYQIAINNIEAKGRRAEEEHVRVPNRSAKDIEWSFFHRLHMNCYCCTKRNVGKLPRNSTGLKNEDE